MKKTQSFGMDWLQNVLEIRPVFPSTEICWSARLNELLADEAEHDNNDWALLVLDSLTDHFTGNWGDVSDEQKSLNDSSLRKYFAKNPIPGEIISKYHSGELCVVINTNEDYSVTVVMVEDEF